MKWIVSLILLLLSFHTQAVVDMKNASFVDVWTDMIAPGPGYDMKIRRSYKSRSLYDGIFGFGWCSDFETHLKPTPEGNLKLLECGSGLEVVYKPKDFSSKEIDKTIQQIVQAHKKEHKNLNRSFYKTFVENLKSNVNLRTHFANTYKIKNSVKTGSVFFANGQQIDRITFAKGVYTRYLRDNTLQKFNTSGLLTYASDKNGNYLKFSYDKKGQLRQVHDNNGRKLAFRYHLDSKKVKEIKGPHNLSVTYQYSGQNLIGVKNAWKHFYSYKYDDLHNLTQIHFPDNTSKKLTYNKDKDWVTSFKDRSNCLETYDYQPQSDDPQNHYVSKVVKKCGKKVTARASYEFWHKKREDGQSYLARVRSDYSTEVIDITYHPVFGKPTLVNNNGRYTRYTYYKNGLLKLKVEGKKKSLFQYNTRYNKVSRLTKVEFNKAGKEIKKDVTNFYYNNKANLVLAKDSGGLKIQIDYDKFGRIEKIIDQAKRVVNVKYEGRFGKPSFVEREGLGAIKISYKSNGEIKTVKSKSGPVVASQVSDTFNSLLGIIQPASEEFIF